MNVWVVIIGLLAISVLLLFISLFLKDSSNDDEIEELSEGHLELSREVYYLKKKIQELEGSPKVMRVPSSHDEPFDPSQAYTRRTNSYEPSKYDMEHEESVSVTPEPIVTPPVVEATPEPSYEAEQVVQEVAQEVSESPVEATKRLHNITKQHIITLYSHGVELDEIADQLNVPVTTVQLVVDNYFEKNPQA